MYYNCTLTNKLGIDGVIDPRGGVFTETPIPGIFNISTEEYPALFEKTDQGIVNKLSEGWGDLPLYRWDGREIVPFNPYENEFLMRHARRKNIIQPIIRKTIATETELKKIRKAMKVILTMLEQLGARPTDDPAIKDFLALSDSIEGTIARFPKEKIKNYVNLRKENLGEGDSNGLAH